MRKTRPLCAVDVPGRNLELVRFTNGGPICGTVYAPIMTGRRRSMAYDPDQKQWSSDLLYRPGEARYRYVYTGQFDHLGRRVFAWTDHHALVDL